MAFLRLIDQAIGCVCRGVLYLTLAVVFAVLSANVALRYAANSSLEWASELPELLFPWMIMAGVVLAAQHGSHIAIVILTQKLGAARRWVLAAGSIAVAALYGFLVVSAWPVLEIAADEKSPVLKVPGSVSVGCIMLGFSLLALVTLTRLPQVWSAGDVRVQHDGPEAEAAPDARQGA